MIKNCRKLAAMDKVGARSLDLSPVAPGLSTASIVWSSNPPTFGWFAQFSAQKFSCLVLKLINFIDQQLVEGFPPACNDP
jgi:hypothetical protein